MSFSTFKVESQIFYRSKWSYGLVNLKPIVEGHVLCIPRRVVPRLSDLNSDEVADLFLSVQRIASVLGTAYKAQGTTISLQDGPVAGQSVPHVHVHILPRRAEDYARNDDIYGDLDTDSAHMKEEWERALAARPLFTSVDDEARKPRTLEQMETEAQWLATLFS